MATRILPKQPGHMPVAGGSPAMPAPTTMALGGSKKPTAMPSHAGTSIRRPTGGLLSGAMGLK